MCPVFCVTKQIRTNFVKVRTSINVTGEALKDEALPLFFLNLDRQTKH